MKTREEIKAEIKRIEEIRNRRETRSDVAEAILAERLMALRWTLT